MYRFLHQNTIRIFIGFCLSLYVIDGWTITIGDIQPIGKNEIRFDVTQLDHARYLDIEASISGKPVNYVLEQIDSDLVMIRIKTPVLAEGSSLINISITSPAGSSSRFYTYSNVTADNTIHSVQAALVARDNPGLPRHNKVIVPVTRASDMTVDTSEPAAVIENGRFVININGGVTSVGQGLQWLANANNYNVLILPGDQVLHEQPLYESISDFEDLYRASKGSIAQIHLDEDHKLVRITSERIDLVKTDTPSALAFAPMPIVSSTFAKEIVPESPRSMREIIQDIEDRESYQLIEYPGDESILDRQIETPSISTFDGLADLVYAMGGQLDIDVSYHPIAMRVRK